MSTPSVPFPGKPNPPKLVLPKTTMVLAIPKPGTSEVKPMLNIPNIPKPLSIPTIPKPGAQILNIPTIPKPGTQMLNIPTIPKPGSTPSIPKPVRNNLINLPGVPLDYDPNAPKFVKPVLPSNVITNRPSIPSPSRIIKPSILLKPSIPNIPSPSKISTIMTNRPKTPSPKRVGMVFTPEMINEDTIYGLAEGLNQPEFLNLLEFLADAYYYKEPLVSDLTFDRLTQLYEKYYEKYTSVGGTATGEKVDLPYYVGSLNKKMTEHEIDLYTKQYPGDYIIMDKIDGLTLIDDTKNEITTLYTHGRNNKGKVVTHLLSYMKFPRIAEDVGIRGEIVLTKDAFKRLKTIYPDEKGPRTTANGAVMAEDSIDPIKVRELSYYAFHIISEVNTPEEDLIRLQELGFKVPHYIKVPEINQQFLEEYYLERRDEAEYEMDGLVIYQNRSVPYPTDGNPKHVIAFKTEAGFEKQEATVTHIEWQASKEKVLSPVVYYEMLQFSDRKNDHVTGKNAEFIESNNIGPGAKLLIQLNIVPEIAQILEPAPDGPGFPDPEIYGEYNWDKTHKRLILLDDNDQVLMRRLKHFIRTLEIKNFGEERLNSFVAVGINDITSLLNATPEQLENIPRMGSKLANQLMIDLRAKLDNVPLPVIADASGFFPNIGKGRFEMIVEVYPHLLDMAYDPPKQIAEKLRQVRGIATLADTIATILPDFFSWLQKHPMITVAEPEVNGDDQEEERGNQLVGKNIVFSGFRGDLIKELTFKAKQEGGNVQANIAKKTNLLVIKDYEPSTLNKKYEQAVAAGIEIITVPEFRERYGF